MKYEVIKENDIIIDEKNRTWRVFYVEFESSYGGIYRYDCADRCRVKSFPSSKIRKANLIQKIRYYLKQLFP